MLQLNEPAEAAEAIADNIHGLTCVVEETALLWLREAFEAQKKLAASQTGLHPPYYIAREKRMTEIIAEIDRKFGPGRQTDETETAGGNLQ